MKKLAIAVAGLALAGLAACSTQAAPPPMPTAPVHAVPTASVPHTPASTPTASPSPMTIAQWQASSPGYPAFTRAVQDLSAMQADSAAGNTPGTLSDAYALAADAHTAEVNPMPGPQEAQFILAMGMLNAAAGSVVGGNDAQASNQLNMAGTEMNAITAQLDG